jgi:fructose-1,6-bisphosphatase II
MSLQDAEQPTLDLLAATLAAVSNCWPFVGDNDKNRLDQAAVDAMRYSLNLADFGGVVVIGEGEKDQAPMLFNGERVGNGSKPLTDVAVDPIDGTTLTSLGRNNALSVLAVAERGSMFNPGPCVYMEKIAVSAAAANAIDITVSPTKNLKEIAKATKKSLNDLVVVILERPRHDELIAEVRSCGCRIHLISDGDIAGAIAAASPHVGVDVLMGIGGTPEGVTAAAALKSLGGQILGRLWVKNDAEAKIAKDAGYDLSKILTVNDLCSGDDVFFAATGVTDGELLRGVRYDSYGATSQSLVMRSRSGTVRVIDTQHRADRIGQYSSAEFQ